MKAANKTFNINPDNLQYKWRNLETDASGVKRFETCLTEAEKTWRAEEREPLTRKHLDIAIAEWNSKYPSVWQYEVI